MKTKRKLFGMILSLAMAVSMMVGLSFEAKAAAFAYSYSLTGNTGAVINVTSGESNITATSSDSAIATASVSGSKITVKAVSGAVGIATITIKSGSTVLGRVDVPVGYTTFIFNKNELMVYAGSDATYEVYGISKDVETETILTGDVVGNGFKYTNTSDYSLRVNVKKKGGTYVFSGTGNDMSITVNKAATGEANLLLAGLNLTSAFTSPITVKKESTSQVNITALAGTTNTLKDNALNNSDTYGAPIDGGNGTNAYYAESAVIKCKSFSNVTLNGTGTLNIIANAKNAIKSGSGAILKINDLTLNINSVEDGISVDNITAINSGNLSITAKDDAIKADPDVVDGVGLSIISISGGTHKIVAGSDGIRSAQDIYISGGSFNIKTGNGYNDTKFNSSTMSCKGIKATTLLEDKTMASNVIRITGGTFTFNTADDAIHSSSVVDITKGSVEISTGDDAIHAARVLNIGTSGEANASVKVNVKTSYEGLEAGTVNIFSGTVTTVSSDDGINAAGGKDYSGEKSGFIPGGNNGRTDSLYGGIGTVGGNISDTSFELNVYGGSVNVNANGDGLDSNGYISLKGGNVVIFSAAADNDNSPLDCDNALTIKGATVFAAGSNKKAALPSTASQPYIRSTSLIEAGKYISVKNNGTNVYTTEALRNVNYVLYSSPAITSVANWSIAADNIGTVLNGWVKEGTSWCYYVDNKKATGWKQLSGKWYYFGTNGAMTTGWKQLSGKWYYFNASGVMQTGWQKIGNEWYYFETNGVMATSWKQLSGKWYYLNASGVMQIGWQKIGNKWYYFETNGVMATGWKQLGDKWYYLGTNGVMVSDTTITISGRSYTFNASGVWIK